MSSALPEECFETTDLANGRSVEDFPLDTDKTKFDQLTVDHVITEFRACHSDNKIVGMQLTYGVWTAESETEASDLVKMQMHGTVFELGDELPNITCEVLEFSEGQYIRGMQFYSSASTITQLSVVQFTPGGIPEMPAFGSYRGSNKSKFFNF